MGGGIADGIGHRILQHPHYSLALDAWSTASALTKVPRDANEEIIGNCALGELAYMYARLGRMNELDVRLESSKGRIFRGASKGRISGNRDGLLVKCKTVPKSLYIAARWPCAISGGWSTRKTPGLKKS